MTGHSVSHDERGFIKDILTGVKLDGVTLIHTRAGAVRGNHWHAETVQWTYVLTGCLAITTRPRESGEIKHDVARPGDLVVSLANEDHAWRALEDSDVLVFTSGPRSGVDYETDTIRLADVDRLMK